MSELNIQELQSIKASGIHWGVVGLIGGIITFFVGVIDGYTNPSKCR